MLGRLREIARTLMLPVCKFLDTVGFSSDLLSVMDLIFSIVAAYMFAVKMPLQAAILVLLSGFFDAVDGGVARLNGKTSGFGATLDATIDRFTEFFQALGVTIGGYVELWLGMAVAFTMNTSSYVRARAESTGGMKECSVGLIERPEKLLLLSFGGFLAAFFGRSLEYTFWLLLILGQVTVIQRLTANWRHSRSASSNG